jgi:hypothetical protein
MKHNEGGWYAWKIDGSQWLQLPEKPVLRRMPDAFVSDSGVFDDGHERFSCLWFDDPEAAREAEKLG